MEFVLHFIGLKLIVLGRAKTEWSRKDQPDGPVHAYQGHETYLDKTMTLYDAGKKNEEAIYY